MRVPYFRKMLLAGAGALALSACGGGGGPRAEVIPPAPTSPTPTPTPPPAACEPACLQPALIFPNIHSSTNFAAIGLETKGSGALVEDGFAVSYNAEAGAYIVDLPSSPAAGFYQDLRSTPNDRYWNGRIAEGTTDYAFASVFKPLPTNPEQQLTYTTFAMYNMSQSLGQSRGFVAFGTPTPTGAVPTTGSATYKAGVFGTSINTGFFIRGSATLQFDFGAGTLAGHFDPVIYDFLAGNTSLGRYDFINTVYSAGSTGFSGQLSKAGATQTGAFDGQFTGPSAQELMARWSIMNGANPVMFGVWVGSK